MGSRCIPLSYIGMGIKAKIENVMGGQMFCKKLMEMGFNKGTIIKVMKNDAGPMILKLGESRLVLGRGMAQKVMVEEVN